MAPTRHPLRHALAAAGVVFALVALPAWGTHVAAGQDGPETVEPRAAPKPT